MAARPSTFGNMVLALTVICLVCAALLGLVQHVTAGPIARTDQQKENAAIAAVVPAFDNEPSAEKTEVGESVVFTARSGEEVVGYAIKVRTGGFGGTLVMMVGFTPDGTVYNTSVLSHSETPGLGAKITDAGVAPRAQVIGKNPATTVMDVKKHPGDSVGIDGITASTITSRAFLKGIRIAHEVFCTLNPLPVQEPENTENNEQQPQ